MLLGNRYICVFFVAATKKACKLAGYSNPLIFIVSGNKSVISKVKTVPFSIEQVYVITVGVLLRKGLLGKRT
jgi:hypothetical protein